jgi:hypothetical protein
MTVGRKAFRLDASGRLRFLFHAHAGSSIVPLDVWITAKARWVTDGQRQKKYRSGFHFIRDERHIERFNRLTKSKYVFLPVQVRDIRPKPRTTVGSWLAREVRIPASSVKALKVSAPLR